MSDSRDSDGSASAPLPDRNPRYESVVRWVAYMREQPPEVWGPQQNAVVNGQLESAALLDRTAEEERRIRAFADEVLDGEEN
ncbi:hypothetical protein [Haloparvum sedimenti]|uniref:hypothetical protein n=1 Tax=Haloparvum sedimenti TaxID=1678448 RepID=UPI00071E8FA0|nr:hypothetical protein [Haloparvum sedimenti]